MDARKLEFAKGISRIVDELCQLIFNVGAHESYKILRVAPESLEEMMQKITFRLPNNIFEERGIHHNLLEELKHLCAQEFIFFQVQEMGDHPGYEKNLESFIQILSRDIGNRVALHDHKTSLREEKNG